MGKQKSADAIVGWLPPTEGLNMLDGVETDVSMMNQITENQDEIPELAVEGRERVSREYADEVINITATKELFHEGADELLEQVLARPNMLRAYERVLRNKGGTSGAGGPFGPTNGSSKYGLGVTYNAENLSVTLGVQHIDLGDQAVSAATPSGAITADMKGNSALVTALKTSAKF